MKPREAFVLYGRLSLHKNDSSLFWRATARLPKSEKYSLRAVKDCISTLKFLGENETLDALYNTYFTVGRSERKNAPITSAVKKFAQSNYMDERTVYRRLEKASKLYISILNEPSFLSAA